MLLALDPTIPPQEAVDAAQEDWARDCEGNRKLSREQFKCENLRAASDASSVLPMPAVQRLCIKRRF
eukprot:6207218-Pleurochrysis_carterae.AAC.2